LRYILYNLHVRLCENSFFFCGFLAFATHFLSTRRLWGGWWQCFSFISVLPDRQSGCNNLKITWFGHKIHRQAEGQDSTCLEVKKKKKQHHISRGRRK